MKVNDMCPDIIREWNNQDIHYRSKVILIELDSVWAVHSSKAEMIGWEPSGDKRGEGIEVRSLVHMRLIISMTQQYIFLPIFLYHFISDC